MRKLLLLTLLLLALSQLVGIIVGLPHKSLSQANDVKIVGTSYLEQVAEKLKQPVVTTEQAVEYANDLLSKNGFDYDLRHAQ